VTANVKLDDTSIPKPLHAVLTHSNI